MIEDYLGGGDVCVDTRKVIKDVRIHSERS